MLNQSVELGDIRSSMPSSHIVLSGRVMMTLLILGRNTLTQEQRLGMGGHAYGQSCIPFHHQGVEERTSRVSSEVSVSVAPEHSLN